MSSCFGLVNSFKIQLRTEQLFNWGFSLRFNFKEDFNIELQFGNSSVIWDYKDTVKVANDFTQHLTKFDFIFYRK